MVEFGYDFRKRYFPLINDTVVPVNHAAYGVPPFPVFERQRQLMLEEETYTDRFFVLTCYEDYLEQLKLLGSYLRIDYRNLVFIINATSGINAVLRSIPWDFKDKILLHSTSYGACSNTVKFLSDYFKVDYDIVKLDYPLEDEEVLRKFEEKLFSGEYKLCLFDMISSMPGVMLPYERLISLCRKYNVWSLLDGAHAVGQVDLDFLDKLKPDFMTTNLHKWLFVPRSSAILYVNPIHHDLIQTFPISHSYGTKSIESPSTAEEIEYNDHLLFKKFGHVGTATYSQVLATSEALKFRSEICGGEENIRKYQYDVQRRAIDLVKRVFGPGSELLQNSTNTLTPPGLFNVSLPLDDKYFEVLDHLQNDLRFFKAFKFKCDKEVMNSAKAYVPFIVHNGKIWVRFSVCLYNEAEDYEIAAKSIKPVIEYFLNLELEKTKQEPKQESR